MALNLTKAEFRAVCAKLRALLAEGKDPDEVAVALGLGLNDYDELLRRFYEHEADDIRNKTTEQVYVEYSLKQTQNIRDLNRLLASFEDTKQHAAMVGAVRARSDILDKIIAKGQEFGFIEKKPETKLVAGVIVSQLSTPELRKAIAGELGQLNDLMTRFGDAPSIIDIDPGPTHLPTPRVKQIASGAPPPPPPPRATSLAAPPKSKAHKRNSVHGGRRVVKKVP